MRSEYTSATAPRQIGTNSRVPSGKELDTGAANSMRGGANGASAGSLP